MKIANTDREFIHIFLATLVNSMKSLVNMCFKIMLKVTKNQGFILYFENIFFGKITDAGGGDGQFDSLAVLASRD